MSVADPQPLVSIGMPLYNEERFVEQSLKALLAQDYQNIEIIIRDNASTDGTAAICQRYAGLDSRIILHRAATNEGAAVNFQRVRELAKGEFFMWASGHDLWSANFVGECVNALQQPDTVLAFGIGAWLDADGVEMSKSSGWTDTRGMQPAARFMTILWGNMHPILGLIRSSALQQIGQVRSMVGADLVMLCELVLQGDFIHVVDARWWRREFRGETTHQAKVARYSSDQYGLARSKLDRLLPLLRLPLELLKVVSRSSLPVVQKGLLMLVLLPTFALRYVVGKQ